MFGFPRVLVEVAAVSSEAFGEAEREPVGGFVKGAGMFVGIVETFCQKWNEAVAGFELAAESAQGEGEALAGEVGTTGVLDDAEAPQLHDEFEAVGAGDRVPADVLVTLPEALGSSTPAKDGHKFGAVQFRVGAVDSLPKNVSGGATGFEIVPLVEGIAELGDLGFFGGGA